MTTTSPMTAEQLLALPSHDGRCKLVAGELRMMSPSGWRHGEIVGKLLTILGHYVQERRLGTVFGAKTGFLLARDPDTVRAPDIAFIARENLPQHDPSEAFWPGAPDLAVEVLSPADRTGEVDEKIQMWLTHGVRLVWVVDPQMRSVTAYRSATDVVVKTPADLLEGGPIVVGFQCPVADIFTALR